MLGEIWMKLAESSHSDLSIYLHIPFCASKCTFCAFNTYVGLENLKHPFVLALKREISLAACRNPYAGVGTIFFGGGTPSRLAAPQLVDLLNHLQNEFRILPDAEISLEANPDDLDTQYLSQLRDGGFNRLSLGMQSARQDELELFGRRHNHQTTIKAVQSAREAGFDNINLDLIFAAPGQRLMDWEGSLDATLELDVVHVSLYALMLEDKTPMTNWVNRGVMPEPDDDVAAAMYELASKKMALAGYEQYEISNWAYPGYECRHNLQYWHNQPYLGLGPGAHGYASGIRYATTLSPHQYIKRLLDHGPVCEVFPLTPAVHESHRISREDEIIETMMLSFRLIRDGVNRNAFRRRFGIDPLEHHRQAFERLKGQGLLEISEDCIRLTQKGRFMSNVVLREVV